MSFVKFSKKGRNFFSGGKLTKVKAIPDRGCIDWNRCSSASRPPLFVDGISSKKIVIRVEQIHTSCNALLFNDFRTIVSWNIRIFLPFEIFWSQNESIILIIYVLITLCIQNMNSCSVSQLWSISIIFHEISLICATLLLGSVGQT